MQVEEEVEQLVMKVLQLEEMVDQVVGVKVHLVMELLLINQLELLFQEQSTLEEVVEEVDQITQVNKLEDLEVLVSLL
jgi:hypothetical protein